jgi:hypothetical protein
MNSDWRAVLVLLATLPPLALADSELHVGTWKKNAAESINMADPKYQETVVVRQAGRVLDFTWTGVSADGKTDTFSYSGKVDGKEKPLPGKMGIIGTLTATPDGITRSVLRYKDGSTEDKMCILTVPDKLICYATFVDAQGKTSIFKEVFDRDRTAP